MVIKVAEITPPATPPPPGIPRAFEKIVQMPGPASNFCWQMPPPRSFCGGQMPGPPVHPINIQSYWLPYFNKHNYFNSIELHKTGHEMSHFD